MPRKRSPAFKFDALPASLISCLVHLGLVLLAATIMFGTSAPKIDHDATYQVTILPARPVFTPPPDAVKDLPPVDGEATGAVDAGSEAPLYLDAPVGDHNETANDCDKGTAALVDSIGVGPGVYGAPGGGGRRYLRTAAGRAGARSTRAVDEGLSWLARHQSREGDWSRHTDRCEKGATCCANLAGNGSRKMAITSLALLSFLANGEVPGQGPHGDNVKRGLAWVASHEAKNGQFESSYPSDDYYSLYEQSIATWMMAEASAATGDPRWRDCATRGIAWLDHRYRMTVDTSVMGFVVMAAKSAECAGIPVPERLRAWGPKYFQLLVERKGRFAYRIEEDGKGPMPDIGVYASLLYKLPDASKAVARAVDEGLAEGPLRDRGEAMNLYHLYYWTLSYLHAGGEDWPRWDAEVRERLAGSQVRDGCARGSWAPDDERVSNRVLSTAFAILTIHVCDRKLLLHRVDSAQATSTRVTKESMEYGELLRDEGLRACADVPKMRATAREAYAAVQAFLDWSTTADARTDEDRHAIEEWTREATEAAAAVAMATGDYDGALGRLAGAARLTPGGRVLRAMIRVKRLPEAKDADAERLAAAQDLASALAEAPGQTELYRLLAYLVKDLAKAPAIEASAGSLVRLAIDQGILARDVRAAIEAKKSPEGMEDRLGAARRAIQAARLTNRALSALLDGWEEEVLLSSGRIALVAGRPEAAEDAAREAGRVSARAAADPEVALLLGGAALSAATAHWNAGRREEAASHAAAGAAAYAWIGSLDAAQGKALALATADLFCMAGEFAEAATRYRRVILDRPKDASTVRERLLAALEGEGDFVAAVGVWNEAHPYAPLALSAYIARYESIADKVSHEAGRLPEAIARYRTSARFLSTRSTISDREARLRHAEVRLATLELAASRFGEAAKTIALLRASRLPDDAETAVLRLEASLARGEKRWKDAARIGQAWLERLPRGTPAWEQAVALLIESYDALGDKRTADAIRASRDLTSAALRGK